LDRREIEARVVEGIRVLNQQYWSPTLNIWLDRPGDDLRAHYEGRRNPPWWPSANAVEMLIDFMNATGRTDYDKTIADLYTLQKDRIERVTRVVAELRRRKQWTEKDESRWERRRAAMKPPAPGEHYSDFQNEYLDDSGWWAVTWLKMYDRTRDERYLATARNIHAHMARSWNPEKGGGVLWCEDADKQHPNAITNNLFLILSARLYTRTRQAAYLDWAKKTLAWMDEQKLFDGTAVVDAPGHVGDYWSYNQGTYIGGLVALWEATGDAQYERRAAEAALAMLRTSGLVTEDGVLIEKLGIGGDAALFKGVFARYLAQLRSMLAKRNARPEVVAEIDRVLTASAQSLLVYGIAPNGMFTKDWHLGGEECSTDFNSQTAGVACLVAALSR
jgi:predicted alpha-1,6-mannanase (GH76 family)